MLKEMSVEIIRKCPNRCMHCSSLSDEHCKEILEYNKFTEIVDDAKELGAKNRIAVCFILIFVLSLLSSCSNASASLTAQTVIEMELTQNYDSSDPFINEKLFYVSDNVDTLNLDVSFQMEGESGILEIADNEIKQVIWSDTWNGNVDNTTFTISLDDLDKEKEYVVRFTGTKIKHAKIIITSENSLVKERERPQKPNRG